MPINTIFQYFRDPVKNHHRRQIYLTMTQDYRNGGHPVSGNRNFTLDHLQYCGGLTNRRAILGQTTVVVYQLWAWVQSNRDDNSF